MAKKKLSTEEYIERSDLFAQPILHFIRECMFEAYSGFEEEIKWNFPCFLYNGTIVASMAGFKQHATLGFWLSSRMSDPHGVFVQGEGKGMGNFGKIRSIEDLPSKEILKSYIHEAMSLHDLGVKVSPGIKKKVISENSALLDALKSNETAQHQFTQFSSSQKGEYFEWANDAKTEATREKRIAQAIEWIAKGKPRNWKYMKGWSEEK